MQTLVEFTNNGIKVVENTRNHVSTETWDWAFNIFTQASEATLTSGPGYVEVQTNNPGVKELVTDLANDSIPDYWYVRK